MFVTRPVFTRTDPPLLSDRDGDTSEDGRKLDPLYKGYWPSNAGAQIFATIGSVNGFLGFGAAKIGCIAVLAAASSRVAVAWLAVEFLLLLCVRAARGQWRFFQARNDGGVSSLLAHLFTFVCVLAVPFPNVRRPHSLGPDLYCFSLI